MTVDKPKPFSRMNAGEKLIVIEGYLRQSRREFRVYPGRKAIKVHTKSKDD